MNTQFLAGLTRRTDQAKIAGVCAGLAAHFGWRLKGVRLAMIALCIFVPPIGFGLYIAGAVLLPPAGGFGGHAVAAGFAPNPPPPPPAWSNAPPSDARERVQGLEQRLREIEAYMTSSRYEFDRQLRSR